MEFVGAVKGFDSIKKRSKHNDDLFVDRLNHRYTVVIIIIFVVVITTAQYGGKPIKCWVPGHFTGVYGDYADNICWVSSTYNVPIHEELPISEQERKVKMLKYYQWTPFILLFQALLFYFPRMIWRSFNNKSGLDLQSIVDAVYKFQGDASSYAERKKFIDYLTNIFGDYVESAPGAVKRLQTTRRQKWDPKAQDPINAAVINVPSSHDDDEKQSFTNNYQNPEPENKKNLGHIGKIFCITKGKRYGNFLLILFFFVKILYLINSFAQLFILNHFLGNNYLVLGAEVLSKIWSGEDWAQTERFPRVTMCDFRIREVGITHRYTVQCVLQINLFNEKIFIFIWFWLCIVTILNLIDLVSWFITLVCNTHQRYSYIKRRLYAMKPPVQRNQLANSGYEDDFQEFVDKYLRDDGVLALHILSRNAHDLIVSEVVEGLYRSFRESRRIKEGDHSERDNRSSHREGARHRQPANANPDSETHETKA